MRSYDIVTSFMNVARMISMKRHNTFEIDKLISNKIDDCFITSIDIEIVQRLGQNWIRFSRPNVFVDKRGERERKIVVSSIVF